MTTQTTHPTFATVLNFAADLVEGLDLAAGVTVYPARPYRDVVLAPTIHINCQGLDELVGVADRIGASITTRHREADDRFAERHHHVAEGEWAGVRVEAAWVEYVAAVTA